MSGLRDRSFITLKERFPKSMVALKNTTKANWQRAIAKILSWDMCREIAAEQIDRIERKEGIYRVWFLDRTCHLIAIEQFNRIYAQQQQEQALASDLVTSYSKEVEPEKIKAELYSKEAEPDDYGYPVPKAIIEINVLLLNFSKTLLEEALSAYLKDYEIGSYCDPKFQVSEEELWTFEEEKKMKILSIERVGDDCDKYKLTLTEKNKIIEEKICSFSGMLKAKDELACENWAKLESDENLAFLGYPQTSWTILSRVGSHVFVSAKDPYEAKQKTIAHFQEKEPYMQDWKDSHLEEWFDRNFVGIEHYDSGKCQRIDLHI